MDAASLHPYLPAVSSGGGRASRALGEGRRFSESRRKLPAPAARHTYVRAQRRVACARRQRQRRPWRGPTCAAQAHDPPVNPASDIRLHRTGKKGIGDFPQGPIADQGLCAGQAHQGRPWRRIARCMRPRAWAAHRLIPGGRSLRGLDRCPAVPGTEPRHVAREFVPTGAR